MSKQGQTEEMDGTLMHFNHGWTRINTDRNDAMRIARQEIGFLFYAQTSLHRDSILALMASRTPRLGKFFFGSALETGGGRQRQKTTQNVPMSSAHNFFIAGNPAKIQSASNAIKSARFRVFIARPSSWISCNQENLLPIT